MDLGTVGTAIEEKGAFSICVPGSFGPADGKALDVRMVGFKNGSTWRIISVDVSG